MWCRAAAHAGVPDCVAAGTIAALALGACSSSMAPSTTPPPPAPVSVALWVPGQLDRILGYTSAQLASGTSAAPAVIISRGLNLFIAGVALDARGNLWVSESGGQRVGGAVVAYTASQLSISGNPTPKVALTSNATGSLAAPGALAFDAGGNLWVANGLSGPGENTIVEFTVAQLDSGAPTPAVTLSANAGSIRGPTGLAFDRSGNLWMTNFNRGSGDSTLTVVEFSASQLVVSGSPIPAVTLSDNGGSLYTPSGLAFDGSGNLWVVNFSGSIVEFTGSQLAITGVRIPR